MSINKQQWRRLTRIAALLKENRYPNSMTLLAEFRKMAENGDLNMKCSKKTILRDMHSLENDFKCPLAFDRGRNGYYLRNHGWNFISPALLDEHEMLAAVIGARIAENIFPDPLRGHIRNAVDFLLTDNNPDFLDTAQIRSLVIYSGLYINIDPDVFMNVFDAWQRHKVLEIGYRDNSGRVSRRKVEPHTLVYFDNSWYVKGVCLLRSDIRTFALHRMTDASITDFNFEPDDDIVRSVNPDSFLGFRKIPDVKIRCHVSLRDAVAARPFNTAQKIQPDRQKDHFTLSIPAVSKEEIIPWVLAQQGRAVLVNPESLRDELRKVAESIAEKH